MNPELKLVIFEERNILKDLLGLLDRQHEAILAKEVMELEKLIVDIENAGKSLAAIEIKRRNLIKEDDFNKIIDNCEDDHVKGVYREIRSILNSLALQNNTNDILLKQNLFFTNKMINIIKPSKSIGIYNNCGKVGR